MKPWIFIEKSDTVGPTSNNIIDAMNHTSISAAQKKSASPLLKRAFDVLFSLLVVVTLSPLFLLLALLIKLDSKGPVLYLAKRLGKDRKIITVYKFRTMYLDADIRLKKLIENSPEMKKEWEIFQKLKKDPRCTPIGKFLRRVSLDELPQFFNVLEGSLSVVGPRPHMIEELDENPDGLFRKYADTILSVKPGITGIWQTSGRNHLSYEARIELDSAYVGKQSFFFDLFLILKTIPCVLFSKGAF
ncbi:sugar transferase [Simkania negevensis]|uniref:Undecaprenyl-phosphate galactose phosphotransferase n=1 Tax=Simkania negevensis (strain ATCC VR-1471 / DSM 27360 / Z) TaxID=331113 RepID=F8L7S1_SIMNZ|nr:sugar transferase [Simkania negevensis]CCB88815.1 undecaprenyl-phosphate galactose phosphotransferase [Simkania negevensis Z]